jgi:hypothetical protein
MFRSHRAGAIIRPGKLRLSFPCHWHYDILRRLECLRLLGWHDDSRMEDALDIVLIQDGAGEYSQPMEYIEGDEGPTSRW